MSKAIESNMQAADTCFSETLELLNSGAEEADELQINDISIDLLYYNASQPAYHVVDEVVKSTVDFKGITTRTRDITWQRAHSW